MDKLISDFSLGLFFWQTLLFIILIFFLKKYAWKPILSAVEEREGGIKEALDSAEKAREEMKNLTADNERILSEAKKQRDEILKEAREMKSKIISEAKESANVEAEKLLLSAKNQINTEKAKALNELKNTISDLSIEMASQVINTELSNPAASKKIIEEALNETKLN
tara:strand:+ start:649 stop:1149 length:501 start_codon:yes stop_codon:yes gene_type:complete